MKRFFVPILCVAVLCMAVSTALCAYPQWCPLYKIVEYGPGLWLWALDRHDDPPGDLCNDPTAEYDVRGELAILKCPNCESKKVAPAGKTAKGASCGCTATAEGASAGSRQYVGLEKPVPTDYRYQFPAEANRRHGWVLTDPELPYIKFATKENPPKFVCAKVFLLALDINGQLGQPGAPPRWTYLALEADVDPARPPAGTVDTVAMQPAQKVSGAVAPSCASVYQGKFPRFGQSVNILAVLAAEKPADLAGQKSPPARKAPAKKP